MVTKLGKRLFLSYRGDNFELANELAHRLFEEGWVDEISIVPPDQIALRRELLLVYDYFELVGFLRDIVSKCDSFGFLDLEGRDHWNSYWTQQELTQWRRFAKKDEIYGISLAGVATYGVAPMSKEEKRWLAYISVNTRREQAPLSLPNYWSKYAKSCFLIQCPACGRNLVVTQKAVYATIRGQFIARCGWCKKSLLFKEIPDRGHFYRDRILLIYPGAEPDRMRLTDNELEELLVSKKLPDGFRLIKLPDERLLSDGERVGNFYTLGLYGLAKRLFDEDE